MDEPYTATRAGDCPLHGIPQQAFCKFSSAQPTTQLNSAAHSTDAFPSQMWHQLKEEINRLSNGTRFAAKKPVYNNKIIDQTQISLLFVLSLFGSVLKTDIWRMWG